MESRGECVCLPGTPKGIGLEAMGPNACCVGLLAVAPRALICNFQKRQMFWPWSVQFTILHRNLDALEESKPCACPLRLPTHPHSGANQIWQYFGIMNMSKIVRRPYLDNAKFQALGKYFVKTSSHTAFRRLSQRRAPVWHWAWTGSEENQT